MGIIDKDGNLLKKELPQDLEPGADRDFGGMGMPILYLLAG
jgi:hypothetical protein